MQGSKSMRIAGWVLSILVAVFMIFVSGIAKFTEFEGKDKMFEHLGYAPELMTKIGVVEIAVALLYLIPQTSFLGVILLTGYLGGATATHVRVGDPFFFPIMIGVLAWIGFVLRRPEVFKLVWGSNCCRSSVSESTINSEK